MLVVTWHWTSIPLTGSSNTPSRLHATETGISSGSVGQFGPKTLYLPLKNSVCRFSPFSQSCCLEFSVRLSRVTNVCVFICFFLFVFREDPRDVKTLAQLIKAYSRLNPKKAEQYPCLNNTPSPHRGNKYFFQSDFRLHKLTESGTVFVRLVAKRHDVWHDANVAILDWTIRMGNPLSTTGKSC